MWRKPNKEIDIHNLQPTIKHGGSVVWGCMANGTGNLSFIHGGLRRKEAQLNINIEQGINNFYYSNTFVTSLQYICIANTS